MATYVSPRARLTAKIAKTEKKITKSVEQTAKRRAKLADYKRKLAAL